MVWVGAGYVGGELGGRCGLGLVVRVMIWVCSEGWGWLCGW